MKVTGAGHLAAALSGDSGAISIKFAKARIRIEGRADANALRMVLEHLLR